MARSATRWAHYAGFVSFVSGVLFLAQPKPDLFRFDYGQLATSYSTLLAGLGGFAITVLAVMLGLQALDTHQSSRVRVAAHAAVLRHVALSLAVASITCFIGALMLAEVSAQTSSVERARAGARSEIERTLNAMSLPGPKISELMLRLDEPSHNSALYQEAPTTTTILASLQDKTSFASNPMIAKLASRAPALDPLFLASTRRHLLIANVVSLISSLLILKSITFLLFVRFPSYPTIGGVQDFVVLGFGGMLLIKELHMASYGLTSTPLAASPLLVAAGLAATIVIYQFTLRRKVETLRQSVIQGELGRFTPAAPYFFALGVCFTIMVFLAGTFSNTGPITNIDRVVVGLGAIIASGMLVTIQIERPTLNLLLEADPEPVANDPL